MSSVTQFENSTISIQNVARLFSQSLIALIVTFLIFAGMQKLIESDDVKIAKVPEFEPFNFRYEEVKEKIIEREKIKPPPKTLEQPRPNLIEPQKVQPSSFNERFTLNVPRINNKVGLGFTAMEKDLRPLVRQNPKYPPTAARDGVEGFVVLSFDILPSGMVNNIQIVEAQPRGVFESSAKRALKKWKYQAQFENGEAVTVFQQQVRLDFNLSQ